MKPIQNRAISFEKYLADSAMEKQWIDSLLDPQQQTWAQFDPVTGYRLYNSVPTDGIHHSSTISTVQVNGARTRHHYLDKQCRINTYGNSFTQCQQVSDGETWQEYLAAHFGEPINNFGMGGYGVYQAYRKMLSIEASENAAENIVFYIWGDDHTRSIMRCRYASFYKWFDQSVDIGSRAFHGNFWCNLEMDFSNGELKEYENRLSTPDSLYQMCDSDFMVESLKGDLAIHFDAIIRHGVEVTTRDIDRFDSLAEILNVNRVIRDSEDSVMSSIVQLNLEYGLAATRHIIDKIVEFANQNNKKVLFALLCPDVTQQLLNNQVRYDHSVVEHLEKKGQRVFDMNVAHLEDYHSFNLTHEEYFKRYFIAHYSPIGNHFFAFSIKDSLLKMLNPKPITYQNMTLGRNYQGRSKSMAFEGYLPDRVNKG